MTDDDGDDDGDGDDASVRADDGARASGECEDDR